MKIQTNTCTICGGQLQKREITYTQAIGKRIFIVSDVPALVCSQCGEEYLKPDTVDAIQKVIETGKNKSTTIQVPVYRFPQ